MFKKYLLIFLILIQSCYALQVELDHEILGPEQNFIGTIEISPGNYDPNLLIKVSTTDSSDSKKLKDVIDCDEIDCTGVVDYYTSIGSTESSIQGTDILTGIRIPKDYIIKPGAKFDIVNVDSNYPDTPKIDIGNDNNPEWIYQGYATETFPPDSYYSGPKLIQESDIEPIIIQPSGNCQRLLLPKSIKYQVRAYTKSTSSSTLDIFIPGINLEGACNTPSTNWGWTICNIELTEPLETNYYYICLESQSGNIIASNASALNPKGYVNCLTDCQKVNRDYIIQVKAADYVTQLVSKINYNESNTRPGEYLYQTLASYYSKCNFQDSYCNIPIRVTSKNNGTIKLENLEYIIQNSEIIPKNKFLSSITKTSGENRIISSDPILIKLSEFDVETPKDINDYTLNIEFNNLQISADYLVEELPIAIFNISKSKASVFETISLDASESSYKKDNILKYEWDFGDNKTASGQKTNHRYLNSGTYTIKLIIKDTEKNISSMPYEQTIEIFSSGEEISTLIDNTIPKIEKAISYMNSADSTIKKIYSDLNFDEELIQAKATLNTYKTKLSTLSQEQLQTAQSDVNEILASLPSKISIIRSLDIVPYIAYDDIDRIYPTKSEEFKETIHNLNSRITQKTESKLIKVTYLSNNIENFIFIKKIITPQHSLKDVSLTEFIPPSLTTSENIIFYNNLQPQIETSGNYIEVKINYDSFDSSNEILYKLQSSNIDLIQNIKTIVVPNTLNQQEIPFECGNNICNPAEDYNSCPEDCTCGNKKCDPGENEQNCPQDCRKTPWLIIFVFLVIIVVMVGIGYYANKNPAFAKKLKIEKLLQKIKIDEFFKLFKRNPFETETEFKTISGFIRRSIKKGYPIMKIRKALEDKGWSQEKINYAIKKAK